MSNPVCHPDHKRIQSFMLLCWFIYFAAYLANYSLTASMGLLNAQGQFTKTQLGGFASALFLGYALSQPLLGFAGDYVSPKQMLMAGLSIAGLVNLLFPFCRKPTFAVALWLLNGVAQAMFWPAFVRLSAMCLKQEQASRLCVLLCTCGPSGMLAAYIAAALIGQRSPQLVFALAGTAAFLMLAAILLSRNLLSRGGTHPSDRPMTERAKERPFMKGVWATGLLGLVLGSFLNGMLKDGVVTWLPIYLTENQGISAHSATLLVSALPIINLLGVFFAHKAQKGILREEATTAAVCFLITLLSMILLTVSHALGAGISLAVLCLASSAMVGANTMLAGLAPIRLIEYGHVAFLTGLLNAAVHLGSSLSGALYGYLSESQGWNAVRVLWCALAFAGLCSCVLARRRWRKTCAGAEG